MAATKKAKKIDAAEKGTSSGRVRKEVTRLNKIFSTKSEEEKEYLSSLIKRAAFMKVQLEDLEKDIQANGLTELFKQSVYAPAYTRERPVARVYNSLNKNYQTIMKQLEGFVDKTSKEQGADDGFDAFIRG